MKRQHLLLLGTAAAFLAWIGYLANLTRGVEHPPVHLSIPQFQYAEAVVIAFVKKKDAPIKVSSVFFPAKSNLKTDDEIIVPNLGHALFKWINDGGPTEWELPGEFIIPLQELTKPAKPGEPWSAEVVPLPRTGGLPGGTRIYPSTPSELKELEHIKF